MKTMKILTFILWLCVVGIVIVLAVTPNVMVMHGNQDKMLHVTVFCLLILWPAIILTRRLYIYGIALFLLLLGVAIEMLQVMVSGRESSLFDIAANGLGLILGLVIGYLLSADRLSHGGED